MGGWRGWRGPTPATEQAHRVEPLLIGDALREHWLARLPAGEQMLLEVLVEAYPEPIDRERIDETTGFKRSTGDAYLQRLSARNLAVGEGRGQGARGRGAVRLMADGRRLSG